MWWGQRPPAATCPLPPPIAAAGRTRRGSLSPKRWWWPRLAARLGLCPHGKAALVPTLGDPPPPTSAERGWVGEGTQHLPPAPPTHEKWQMPKKGKNTSLKSQARYCHPAASVAIAEAPWACCGQQLASLHQGGDWALHI